MTQGETQSDARLDDLEMKAAFQEKMLSELNDELVSHGQRIGQLEKQLKELKTVMEHLHALLEKPNPEVDERPPHY